MMSKLIRKLLENRAGITSQQNKVTFSDQNREKMNNVSFHIESSFTQRVQSTRCFGRCGSIL